MKELGGLLFLCGIVLVFVLVLGPIGESFGVMMWKNPMGKVLWTNPLDESNSSKNPLRDPLAQVLWRNPLEESAQCLTYEKLFTDLIRILYMSEGHPTEILQTQYITCVQTPKSYIRHTDICMNASRHHITVFVQECYRHPTAILWESFRMPKARLRVSYRDLSSQTVLTMLSTDALAQVTEG